MKETVLHGANLNMMAVGKYIQEAQKEDKLGSAR